MCSLMFFVEEVLSVCGIFSERKESQPCYVYCLKLMTIGVSLFSFQGDAIICRFRKAETQSIHTNK